MALPPGPDLAPARQALRLTADPDPFLRECAERYGDRFTLRTTGAGIVVVLGGPEDVRTTLGGTPAALGSAPAAYVSLRPMLGSGSLFLLDGEAHQRHRALMAPSFRRERIAGRADLIASVTERHLAAWPIAEPFRLAPRLQAVALDVATRVVFGDLPQDRHELIQRAGLELAGASTHGVTPLAFAPRGPEGAGRLYAFKRARGVLDDILVEEVNGRLSEGDPEGDDVLSQLLRNRNGEPPLQADELRDDLVTLLLAGHESTGVALTWMFERIVRHPHIVERLEAEGESRESSFAEAVVREVLRIRSPAPFFGRRLCERFALGGRTLPAGITVAPSPHLVHRRADLYEDPLLFRPERFFGPVPPGHTWIPFGGGYRRCLGATLATLEMRVVLQTIIAHARLAPTKLESEAMRSRNVLLTPARGGEVVLRERR